MEFGQSAQPRKLVGGPTGLACAAVRRERSVRGLPPDPDARATDAAFWKSAEVVLPTPKETVTMRLDADLLRWFRRERGYQTRINAILCSYMQANKS